MATAHQRKAASKFKGCLTSVKASEGQSFRALQKDFGKCLRSAWGKRKSSKRKSRKSRR